MTAHPFLRRDLLETYRRWERLCAYNNELRRVGAFQRPRAYGAEVRRLVRDLMRRYGTAEFDCRHRVHIIVRDDVERGIYELANENRVEDMAGSPV